MRFILLVHILLYSIFISSKAYAQETFTVKHYQQQARYNFGLKVLNLALSKVNKKYKVIGSTPQSINEARGELLVINGYLDLEIVSTTLQRESSMIPIKIPIYRGLLGLRLLLIRSELKDKFAQVNSLEKLRKFVGGHGAHWKDLPVYAANDLKVITSPQYQNLFKMLHRGRFDYFLRGVSEIWGELSYHGDDFAIVDDVMFFYPHPVYFFVGKHRPELAVDIEKGMRIALADGSYLKLFQSSFDEIIRRANLKYRKLIVLKNPVVSNLKTPIDTSWWLPKFNYVTP